MIPKTDIMPYTSYSSSIVKNGVLKGYDEEQNSKLTSNFDIASLGNNDFLKLLLAELQHQDPLDPAGNTEFVAQLAQFSTLEQMTSINSNFEKTFENNTIMSETIRNAMMINFFGKTVSAESNSFMYDGTEPVDIQFNLDKTISSGKV